MDRHSAQEQELAQAAVRALVGTTGLRSDVLPLPAEVGHGPYRPDVTIQMNTNGMHYSFYAECKALVDRRSVLAQVKTKLAGLNAPGLLIAPYLSREMIESCRAMGLQAIDTAGNAYLEAPGLYVLVKGQEASAVQVIEDHSRLGGSASSLRMIFVLLVDPDLIRAPYRQIAQAAGIALGTVGWVFRDLVQRGLVTGLDKAHGRRLLEPDRLLDEWITSYAVRLRPKLHTRRFQGPDPTWWKEIDPLELDAWWGGEIAADSLTGMLKPATQTLYVLPEKRQPSLRSLVGRYCLRPDPAGEFEILDAFWNLPRSADHVQFVPPILAYADLMSSLDPRNLEVANLMREKIHAGIQHSS